MTLHRRTVLPMMAVGFLMAAAPPCTAEETAQWSQLSSVTFIAFGKAEGGPKPASRQLQNDALNAVNSAIAGGDMATRDTALLAFINQNLMMSGLPFTELNQDDLDQANEAAGLRIGENTLGVETDSPVWAQRVELLLQ